MTAAINFYAGESTAINNLSGSGLGFFGADGFGASVRVGEYQSRTFCTNSAGTVNAFEADNVKFLSAPSAILGQVGTGIALTCVPNIQSSLEVRFTNDTPVRVQNAYAVGFDRVSWSNAPSGLVLKAAEIIHPTISQTNNGSGDTAWTTLAGTGSVLDLAPSPGVSGLYAGNGADGSWSDGSHSWFLALSCSPTQIGSKLFALGVSCEYL